MIRIVFLLALLLSPSSVQAFSELFDEPCARYGVPKAVALSIAKVESGFAPWVVNVAGRDFRAKTREQALYIIHAARFYGLSHDIGIMQINNFWLKKFGLSPEVALEPRNNIHLGVYILACEIQRHGPNWKAVGAYHSPTPWRQARYALRVAKFYEQIRGKNHE
jgi:soluble lytic murein transglycosylase-like protein